LLRLTKGRRPQGRDEKREGICRSKSEFVSSAVRITCQGKRKEEGGTKRTCREADDLILGAGGEKTNQAMAANTRHLALEEMKEKGMEEDLSTTTTYYYEDMKGREGKYSLLYSFFSE